MTLRKLSFRLGTATLLLVACLGFRVEARSATTTAARPAEGASRSAKPGPNADALARIRIDNFGQIDPAYFRGAQPDARDYADLAALGIKTVIDLTEDGREDEPGLVKQAGMTFHRIPLTTTDRPSDRAVTEFLKLVNDPANQPVYVHCQGGRHRTGAMTAIYRISQDGWTADQAYQEMKHYRFEGFPGHPALKSFVYDYYTQFTQAAAAAAAKPQIAAAK
jgi:protein tyrosine/serine phosphatase